jgi:hypothetical protein
VVRGVDAGHARLSHFTPRATTKRREIAARVAETAAGAAKAAGRNEQRRFW